MPTLYEILDALPDDDADDLRAAFRRAAKANHPDSNPGDPDAAQRFRRIVRAHLILSDEQQRAAYDACLTEPPARRSRRLDFRHLAPHPISAMVIAFVSIGAFLLFDKALRRYVVPAREQSVFATASALTAAMPAQPSETIGRAGERDKSDDVPLADKPEAPDVAAPAAAAPVTVASADTTGSIPASSNAGVKDATYYRERGGLAYHSGDLPLALVDFDLAINLDPNFSDAYIDRAVVFRRMGDLKRAFADVAEAKRIDESKPQQAAPPSGNN